MNLISCNNCGTVLDAHKLNFPDPEDNPDGDDLFPSDQYEWDGDCFVPVIKCPSCGGAVRKDGELSFSKRK